MELLFKAEETELIKTAIISRLNELKSLQKNELSEKQILRLYELFVKICKLEFDFNKNEQSLLEGVMNEFIYGPNKDRINYFSSISNMDFLKLPDKEKKEIEYLDKIIDISNKFVPQKKRKRLFKETLDIISSIKNPYLGKYYFSTSENKIYKIGILVNEKQMIAIELDSESEIEHFNLIDIEKSNPKTTYEKTGTKKEIIDLLNFYEKTNKLTYRQKFLKETLN